MTDIRKTAKWQRLRRSIIAAAPRPVMCWRCEQEIEDPWSADLGHMTDVAEDPWAPLRVALEHPSCNRAAGMAAQHERAKRPRTGNVAYVWGAKLR